VSSINLISENEYILAWDEPTNSYKNVLKPQSQDLQPYRLINDTYTKVEVDTKDTNTSNAISTRITNLPAFPSLTPYRLINDTHTKNEAIPRILIIPMLYLQGSQIYLLFQV